MYLKERQVIHTPQVTMKPDAMCQLNLQFHKTNVAAQTHQAWFLLWVQYFNQCENCNTSVVFMTIAEMIKALLTEQKKIIWFR
jgi:hypothetical protein